MEKAIRSNLLVGTVDVIDSQDGQVTVITEVAEGNARAGLELASVDGLLRGIEGDGHREQVAIGKSAVLADTKREKVGSADWLIA